jgi:hypothetical protein
MEEGREHSKTTFVLSPNLSEEESFAEQCARLARMPAGQRSVVLGRAEKKLRFALEVVRRTAPRPAILSSKR